MCSDGQQLETHQAALRTVLYSVQYISHDNVSVEPFEQQQVFLLVFFVPVFCWFFLLFKKKIFFGIVNMIKIYNLIRISNDKMFTILLPISLPYGG